MNSKPIKDSRHLSTDFYMFWISSCTDAVLCTTPINNDWSCDAGMQDWALWSGKCSSYCLLWNNRLSRKTIGGLHYFLLSMYANISQSGRVIFTCLGDKLMRCDMLLGPEGLEVSMESYREVWNLSVSMG